jgi:hypothetical protein
MAQRTTATDVKAIIETTMEDAAVEAYIFSANAMVTQLLGTTLEEATLTEIERWLTAHMIAITKERMSQKEGAGGAFIEYAGNFGAGLQSTSWGQMVEMLDTTGAMVSLGKKTITFLAIPQEDS